MRVEIPLASNASNVSTTLTGPRRKVVLYNPKAVFYTMPLALLAIGSYLDPARYEVIIIDGRLEEDPVAAVRAHLDEALCLGVTVLTGAPIQDAVHLSRAVKAARPDLPIVWGGWHPSMFGKECMQESAWMSPCKRRAKRRSRIFCAVWKPGRRSQAVRAAHFATRPERSR